MKKLFLTIVSGLILSAFAPNNTVVWQGDNSHTKVGFTITHLQLSEIDGYFKNVSATITGTKEDFSDAIAEFTAQSNSIFTDNDQRDAHLKGEDFFEADKFTTISFKSTSIKKAKSGNLIVSGNLTMRGITKPVTLSATAKVGINPMSNKKTAGFRITGKIKRTDFNLGAKFPNAMLSNEVAIYANAEFVKQ